MKTRLKKLIIIALFGSIYFPSQELKAQCGAGFTSAAVNFDMQYMVPTALPLSPINYTFGRNSLQLKWSGVNTFRGPVADHTGQGSSFGTGNDLKYVVGNGADTLIFEKEVTNLRFSVYDIDISHRMVVTARNALGAAINITTLARASGTTLTIAGSGTVSASATASSTAVALTATNATANVTIAGPVKSVVLTFTKTTGTDSIYISDISACNNNTTTGVFALNYQAMSLPEIGQPSYMLASFGDSIVVVDKTNNISQLIYEVPGMISIGGAAPSINSLAYDPYNQMVYYADNARIITNNKIYRYDVKRRINTVWINDVTTMGIQLFFNGMGSGAASFYDGALYIGQDMSAATAGVLNPETVYRIDIDTLTGNPTKASRLWSRLGYDGFTTWFDWSDFVINDGVFYNFNNSATAAANTGITHIDLNSQTVTAGYTTPAMSQVSIDYLGNIYHFSVTGSTASYAIYDGVGGLGTPVTFTGTGSISVTDAAESFKFPYDYGDAPSSYGIAFHLSPTDNLMLGSLVDYEVQNAADTTARGDDTKNTGVINDEEGVASFPTVTTGNTSYSVSVGVTNTTGAPAYLIAYFDFNRDGDFDDAGEQSVMLTIPTGTLSTTPVTVTWVGLTGGVVGTSFIRFRLASSATEVANRYGFASNGEVEDYPVPITASSLPVELISFNGELKENNSSYLYWSTASELNNQRFDVQRRNRNNQWEIIGKVNGVGNSNQLNNYTFTDNNPLNGENYYRLCQVDFNGNIEFSSTIIINVEKVAETKINKFSVYPNPVNNVLWVKSDEEISENNNTILEVYNISGEILLSSVMQNSLQQIDFSGIEKGMYFIKIGTQSYSIIKQ